MAYTKTCLFCGIEFETPYVDQKFCGRSCSNHGRQFYDKESYDTSLQWKHTPTADGRWLCPYQDNVSCRLRSCETCGWNPKVAKARMEAFESKWKENLDG